MPLHSHGSLISFVVGTNSLQEHVYVSEQQQIQGFPLTCSFKEVMSCGEEDKKYTGHEESPDL